MPLHHWPRRNLRIYKGAQLSFYDPPHFELANLHDLNQHPALHLYHLEQIYQSDQVKCPNRRLHLAEVAQIDYHNAVRPVKCFRESYPMASITPLSQTRPRSP